MQMLEIPGFPTRTIRVTISERKRTVRIAAAIVRLGGAGVNGVLARFPPLFTEAVVGEAPSSH